jgi:hypothetical protein
VRRTLRRTDELIAQAKAVANPVPPQRDLCVAALAGPYRAGPYVCMCHGSGALAQQEIFGVRRYLWGE